MWPVTAAKAGYVTLTATLMEPKTSSALELGFILLSALILVVLLDRFLGVDNNMCDSRDVAMADAGQELDFDCLPGFARRISFSQAASTVHGYCFIESLPVPSLSLVTIAVTTSAAAVATNCEKVSSPTQARRHNRNANQSEKNHVTLRNHANKANFHVA